MNEESETPAIQPKSEWTIAEALQFANTLSNHGWTREANADAASSCIYALCRNLRERGNAAAMREALIEIKRTIEEHPCHLDEDATYQIVCAALAAPPRNCDRFKTKEVAATAFANEKKQWIPQQVLWELAPWLDWLFAPKNESEAAK